MRLPNWRYEEIKEKITQLFFEFSQNIPVDVYMFATSLHIILVSYSSLNENYKRRLQEIGDFILKDGFCVIGTKLGLDCSYIYYDDSQLPSRIRFTIMHEIAHIVLEHTESSDLAEAEANFFAKYALAPPALIDLISPEDYIDIAKRFDISNQCAQNCFNYYQSWKKKYEKSSHSYTAYENVQVTCFGSYLSKHTEQEVTFGNT